MKKFLILPLIVAMSIFVIANEDRDDEKKRYKKLYKKYTISTNKDTKAAKLYKEECGSCHMAYQAEFLPKRSWVKLMKPKSLQDHFGVDASLDEADRKVIEKFLVKNAGDQKRVYGEFREFIDSIPKNSTPLKISQVPYFKKEHRKIKKKLITQKGVKSIANCAACHQRAQSGDFDEDSIVIPNYGKWDD